MIPDTARRTLMVRHETAAIGTAGHPGGHHRRVWRNATATTMTAGRPTSQRICEAGRRLARSVVVTTVTLVVIVALTISVVVALTISVVVALTIVLIVLAVVHLNL